MALQRELHGVRWKDELGWMEDMRGRRWNSFIQGQQLRWKRQLESRATSKELLCQELESASLLSKAKLFFASNVEIRYHNRFHIEWNWKNKEESHDAVDLDVCKKCHGYVWVIEEADTSNGAEEYQVCCYKEGVKGYIWKFKGVGPYTTVIAGRCYALEASNKLWYCRLISWDALTGKNKEVHYEELNPRYNLELVKGSCKQGVLRRQAGPLQDCFWITAKSIEAVDRISLESRRFVFDDREPEKYYCWTASKGWEGHGMKHKLDAKGIPEYVCEKRDIIITHWKGQRTIWKNSKVVWHDIGNVLVDPWESSWVRITVPGHQVIWWSVEDTQCPPTTPLLAGRVSLRESKRGVPYVIVLPSGLPKHLLVAGYGAYGMQSQMATQRWEPLLHRGWAICLPMWRGGGDHTPEWEDEGRRDGRQVILEDAEELIREVQVVTGLGAKQTWIYGRSAGGLWAGGIVARNPYGNLIAGAYMEVPYLDVLQTTTNKSLPLTNMEADEFGLPEARLSDFFGIFRWSPMEQLRSLPKQPTVWQIVRTGLNDSQVFAYESAKWVSRSGSHAFLAVEDDQGHFVSGAVGLNQQAEDLAVLLSLANTKIKNRNRVYKMASRKNMTRKNRKNNMRKNRKASRKNRKNTRRNRK